MPLTFNLSGLNAHLQGQAIRAGAAAERAEVHYIERRYPEIEAEIPVDSGDLKGTLRQEGNTIMAGGNGAPYGVIVHEDLQASHPGGGSAKFIERPMFEHADELPAMFAQEMMRRA
jgi:hypothetical protein